MKRRDTGCASALSRLHCRCGGVKALKQEGGRGNVSADEGGSTLVRGREGMPAMSKRGVARTWREGTRRIAVGTVELSNVQTFNEGQPVHRPCLSDCI